jgi:hypothetical protein
MDEISNTVFTATVDCETALIDALAALQEADADDQSAIFESIADAFAPFKTMDNDAREFALRCLLRRGRIPEEGWDRIDTAIEYLSRREAAR